MRAWIRVLDAPGCYERAALQDSGLVRTVGPCAQRREALASGHRPIATARDALSNDRAKVPRVSKGLLSRRGLFIAVSSPVATFKQSKNVAIAHLVGAACFAKGCRLCNRFHLRMRTVLMGNLGHLDVYVKVGKLP